MKGIGWIALAAALGVARPAEALILFGSTSAETNTAAPGGTLANSGFELQGEWGLFQGTPIGPHHFLTAKHLGGTVGEKFTFQGVEYTTVAGKADAVSDLKIWEVAGTFPTFAQLYSGPTETGRELVVVGRGAIKGAEVRVEGALKGWRWGTWDFRLRWGRNVVTGVVDDAGQPTEDPAHFLFVNFDQSGTVDEAHLGVGDSGGGVFIQQAGGWRLAAINYAVDGPYNTTDTGDGFNAAIFDEGGLYGQKDNSWQLVLDLPTPQPGSWYATRVKARAEWIQETMATITPPTLLGANTLAGPYAAVTNASVDAAAKTIRIPIGLTNRFFQLQYATALTIENTRLEDSTLVIEYQ